MVCAVAGRDDVKTCISKGQRLDISLAKVEWEMPRLAPAVALRQHRLRQVDARPPGRLRGKRQCRVPGAAAGIQHVVPLRGTCGDHLRQVFAGGMHCARSIVVGDLAELPFDRLFETGILMFLSSRPRRFGTYTGVSQCSSCFLAADDAEVEIAYGKRDWTHPPVADRPMLD